MQTNPSSPTRKSPDDKHQDFFSYIRLMASFIGFASDICSAIGANLHEAQYAQGTKDFISKLEIAQKECYETAYWLELLF